MSGRTELHYVHDTNIETLVVVIGIEYCSDSGQRDSTRTD
jgi:hypothetical protein